MNKLIFLLIATMLLVTGAGCAAPAARDAEQPDNGTADREVSPAAPAMSVSPAAPEQSGSSTPAPPSGESDAGEPDNGNPVTQAVPAIDASEFCSESEGGSTLSVLCPGVGRYSLSRENAKSLLAYMDFALLTPTDQSNSLQIDSADPGIVFTASDFSYELRLDQNTNLAVYEIGGSTRYYYTMPGGFYDTAFAWASTYAQYNDSDYSGIYEEILSTPDEQGPTEEKQAA